MSKNVSSKQKKVSSGQNVPVPTKSATDEEAPSKGYSFVVGIFIGIAIIVLFVLLFPPH